MIQYNKDVVIQKKLTVVNISYQAKLGFPFFKSLFLSLLSLTHKPNNTSNMVSKPTHYLIPLSHSNILYLNQCVFFQQFHHTLALSSSRKSLPRTLQTKNHII